LISIAEIQFDASRGAGCLTLFLILSGIEARGFIFGPAIALAIGAKFIPLRKPKKLPGEVPSLP
jgi:adenine/guanine phosphoribosyltransferase-like PRPP-binding protein